MAAREGQSWQEGNIPRVDLGNLAQARGLEVDFRVNSREVPEERDHRLRIMDEDARHARWRISAVYTIAILAVLGVTIVCTIIVLNPDSSPEDKAWARPILAATVTGLLGFVVGTKVSTE
jgi:hypothetical protein